MDLFQRSSCWVCRGVSSSINVGPLVRTVQVWRDALRGHLWKPLQGENVLKPTGGKVSYGGINAIAQSKWKPFCLCCALFFQLVESLPWKGWPQSNRTPLLHRIYYALILTLCWLYVFNPMLFEQCYCFQWKILITLSFSLGFHGNLPNTVVLVQSSPPECLWQSWLLEDLISIHQYQCASMDVHSSWLLETVSGGSRVLVLFSAPATLVWAHISLLSLTLTYVSTQQESKKHFWQFILPWNPLKTLIHNFKPYAVGFGLFLGTSAL